MTSRFLVGMSVLATVAVTIGGTAVAQQLGDGRLQRIMQHIDERRSKPTDDRTMTPIAAPGNYRFGFVHDGITREYLVHVPKSYHGQPTPMLIALRSEEHTSELQSRQYLVCR